MQNLLNPDNRVMRFITMLGYSAWLNILWFICCLPIITIGPATTALFYTTQKMVRDEEGYVTVCFFRSLKENFKQGMAVGLIMTILGIFLAIDGYVFYHLHAESVIWTLLTAVYFLAVAAYLVIAMYIFALMARFENDTFSMFKNSLMLGIRFLLCTVIMAVIYFLMLLIVVRFFTPAIVFGMGTCVLFCSMLQKNILLQCEMKEPTAS